jgi:hypothetical protein
LTVTVPTGVNVDPEPIVKVAATVMAPDAVTVAELATVKMLNVIVPELAIEDPFSIVTVPEDGLMVAPILTVSVPFTEKLADG